MVTFTSPSLLAKQGNMSDLRRLRRLIVVNVVLYNSQPDETLVSSVVTMVPFPPVLQSLVRVQKSTYAVTCFLSVIEDISHVANDC